MKSLLEIQNRNLRAVGTTAILAAVAIHVIRWTAIVQLTQFGWPLLP